jgi:TRAP-type C4-dicarboxylate transport system permease small subunit
MAEAAKGEKVAAPAVPNAPPPEDAALPTRAWGGPLARFDAAWTRLETKLVVFALLMEILALALWIALRGLSTDHTAAGNNSGLVFRSLLTATALGIVAHFATRAPKDANGEALASAKKKHDAVVMIAFVAGLLLGRAWVHVGVHFASNLLNWLQNASVLALFGGLRGVATRLTLWLALLGASLATAKGKHIGVDVLVRFIPAKIRLYTTLLGWLLAAVVCLAGSVGFIDYIAIAEFRNVAEKPCPGDPGTMCETGAADKWANVKMRASRDLFLLRRQMALDFKTLPHVFAGENFDKWMTPADWNAWLKDGGWSEHFAPDAVEQLTLTETDPSFRCTPIVSAPGSGESPRGLLTREATFIVPFGLIMIGLRFLLRILLALSGRVRVDPDAAHADDESSHMAHDPDAQPLPGEPGANIADAAKGGA